MKKGFAFALCAVMIFALIAAPACKNNTDGGEQTTNIRIAALKGPTGIGMVKLMDDEYAHYDVSIESAPDALASRFISGDVDVAAVPINLAATLYNRLKGDVMVLSVATLGVLYILEDGDAIKSVADLDGKKLYATGQGATPEYILNYLLDKNGVSADIEYVGEHAALAAMLASGQAHIGMLPQPNVTAALGASENLCIALDLTEEWNKVSDAALVQGVVIARKSFVEKNISAIDVFLDDYASSVEFVNGDVDASAALVTAKGFLPSEELAKQAIPSCNIRAIFGSEMKKSVSEMLKVLFDANPKSIGDKLPADDFYYGA